MYIRVEPVIRKLEEGKLTGNEKLYDFLINLVKSIPTVQVVSARRLRENIEPLCEYLEKYDQEETAAILRARIEKLIKSENA